MASIHRGLNQVGSIPHGLSPPGLSPPGLNPPGLNPPGTIGTYIHSFLLLRVRRHGDALASSLRGHLLW